MLKIQKKKIKLKMKHDVIYIYRMSDEDSRSKLIDQLIKKYNENFVKNWTFFKVENSEYLQYLSKESLTISDYNNFSHFALITNDEIIDLVNSFEPIIEFI